MNEVIIPSNMTEITNQTGSQYTPGFINPSIGSDAAYHEIYLKDNKVTLALSYIINTDFIIADKVLVKSTIKTNGFLIPIRFEYKDRLHPYPYFDKDLSCKTQRHDYRTIINRTLIPINQLQNINSISEFPDPNFDKDLSCKTQRHDYRTIINRTLIPINQLQNINSISEFPDPNSDSNYSWVNRTKEEAIQYLDNLLIEHNTEIYNETITKINNLLEIDIDSIKNKIISNIKTNIIKNRQAIYQYDFTHSKKIKDKFKTFFFKLRKNNESFWGKFNNKLLDDPTFKSKCLDHYNIDINEWIRSFEYTITNAGYSLNKEDQYYIDLEPVFNKFKDTKGLI